MSAIPYAEGALRSAFDAWLEATVARHSPPLRFAEVRKGVVALSSLYVERRARADRALAGAGKRAAFASYYAPLHFLVAWHALRALGAGRAGGLRRVLDLGCGTGATGAACALALRDEAAGDGPRVVGVDRSGWALGEARHTYAAFGLRARLRRSPLARALPGLRAARGDLVVLGWTANELGEGDRETLLAWLREALGAGAGLALLEPLAGAPTPWWPDWVEALAPLGARADTWKGAVLLPAWIRRLDRAAGLDHSVLGARVLRAPASAPARAPAAAGRGP